MTDSHVFANLFAVDNTIRDVSQLVLPSTDLTTACFMQMFSGCAGLTAGVSSLPATIVPISGYQSMFEKCSGMVTGPSVLPATTIGQEAYRAMFNECRVMTTPMYLSATSVSTRGLRYMFNNNYKLTYIEVNFTAWGDSNAMANWTAAVGTNGTFVKPAALPPSTGVNYIPATWTIVDK